MSRSYKKHLFLKKNSRFEKNFANRVVRRSSDIPDGKAYRKFYETWNICDWVLFYDPTPRVYHWGGKTRICGPDPLYRWRMK
jgi:hypothetical protein